MNRPFQIGLAAAVAAAVGITTTADAALIGFNAEDGSSVTATVSATLTSGFTPPVVDPAALGGKYITISTTSGGDSPGNNRYATYVITFPEAGMYDLYARIYLGTGGSPAGATDDSTFYGRGFGAKNPTADASWVTVNGLPEAGVPAGQYLWINLSEQTGVAGETPHVFEVPVGSLTQTFRIGGREDGLRIDALAFGTSTQTFSALQLDTAVVPAPAAMPTGLALIGLGIARRRRR